MPSLLEELRQDEKQQNELAMRMYRELMARAHDARPGDREQMDRVKAQLGLTNDDVEHDMLRLANIRTTEAKILTVEQRDAIQREGEAAARAAEEARRELLIGWLRKADPEDFKALYINLLHSAFRRHGNMIQAEGQKYQEATSEAIRLKQSWRNRLALDDSLRTELAQMRREVPRLYGRQPG